MATIKTLECLTIEVSSRHTDVAATYSILDCDEGRCLQIDTYGSSQRKLAGKKSQSIRLTPAILRQLKCIMEEQGLG